MPELINNLLALGRQRLMILGATSVALMAALLFGLSAVSSPDFTPLYKNLSLTATNSIETTLAGAGFEVQVSDDGSSVLVPREDLVRARMVLAETGIPIDGEAGWELFDDASGLTMNSFLQKVNRLRALEGELARSIQTLDGVQSARVHLVLPERDAFAREAPVPRASVIVRSVPGRAVSRKQAMSIRNLIASAVAELDLTRVTVLSANGETILAETADGDGNVSMQSNKFAIEERLGRDIEEILTARVGAGNARVRVNVELTTEREVIVEQSYNPDQQVVRSTENKSESQAGSENGGNVGVENNIPEALADPGAGNTSQRSKSGETINYEIGNTRREVIREAGEVRRVSVAVLVNGIYSVDGSDVTYAERGPEEINRLTELVKTAVGFDGARGDQVSVDSLRFMDYSMDVGEPVSLSMMQRVSQNIVPIVRGLLALLIVGLVVLLGVRPVLRQMRTTDGEQKEIAAKEAKAAALEAQGAAPPVAAIADANAAPGAATAQGANAVSAGAGQSDGERASRFDPAEDNGPHEYIETMGIRGNLLKARVEAVQKMADDRPEDVLRVMRSWLLAEAEA
ncbi:flagellar basal-body MS-ring/collar protein FliF [Shimia sp.]|uniref:flagellar basal-body MS-ring/collar protein FliF n=1 Tax=Shimia sp. TaxID=1954381 RepID=UPI00356B3BED